MDVTTPVPLSNAATLIALRLQVIPCRRNPARTKFSAFVQKGPLGPPSLLYNRYLLTFPALKRPECGVNHPATINAEVEERVELHLYFRSGPSWPVLG
jgi:hypothetical protein